MICRFLTISVFIYPLLSIAVFLQASSYVVQKNDTLWGIARKFNTQSDKIEKINDLIGVKLKSGQKIAIPDRIIKYTVKSGDNLTRIAKKNHSKVQYIILYNNLPHETIQTGMKLRIPETESAAVQNSRKPATSVMSPSKKMINHLVIKGNTLTALSEKYNVSISEIMSWNRKKNESIHIGEKLKIYSYITVKKEDVFKHSEPSPPASPAVKLSDPASFRFPIERVSISRVARSGRGVIVYLDGKTEIRNIREGTVEYAGRMTGYNNIVIVNYGKDERAVFGFMNRLFIREGNTIPAGHLMGTVEQTSYLGKIQFYFEVRKGKGTVDLLEIYPFLKNGSFLAKQ